MGTTTKYANANSTAMSVADLREAVHRDKEAVASALAELRQHVVRQFAVGERLVAQPYPWLLGAFVVGWWVGWKIWRKPATLTPLLVDCGWLGPHGPRARGGFIPL